MLDARLLRAGQRVAGPLLAVVVAVAATGCGERGEDQQTQAKRETAAKLAKQRAGVNPDETSEKFYLCSSWKVVEELGLERLEEQRVISRQGEPLDVGRVPDEHTLRVMAKADIDCLDWPRQREGIQKSTGATDTQVDSYIDCQQHVGDDVRVEYLVRTRSGGRYGDAAKAKDYLALQDACDYELTRPE